MFMNTVFFRVQHDVVHLPQNGQSGGLGEGSGLQTAGPPLLPHALVSQCRQLMMTSPVSLSHSYCAVNR